MSIYATAGAKVSIGGAKAAQSANFVAADFAADTWLPLGWVENIGSFGDESSEVTFDAIGEGRTQKLKGIRNAGNMELVMGIDYTDAGQAALRAAQLSPNDYAWKIEFNDMPAGGTTNSIRYFVGKVMSAMEQLDGANSVMKLNATIGINSNVVAVNAA